MSNFFDTAIQLTKALKNKLEVPIIWGGIHPTIRPEECLDYADIICRGEAELSLVELAQKIEKKENYFDIKGMWFKRDGEIIKNNFARLIENLDSIPFMDYAFENQYMLDAGHLLPMNESLLMKGLNGAYETMATRGCPYSCTYCGNSTINNLYSDQKILRKRSIENIIEELIQVKKALPFIKCIRFDDDNFFTYSLQQITELSKSYKKEIDLHMHITGIHPNTVNQEKLSLLVDAGLVFIRMGVQTASAKTRKLYERRQTNERVAKSVGIIHTFKDSIPMPQYDVIIDNPWETDDDLAETLLFLAKFQSPFFLELLALTFYPETELCRRALAEGLITNEHEEVYRGAEYHNYNDTFMNKLFILLKNCAEDGEQISVRTMYFMTDRKFRKIGISWAIYKIFCMKRWLSQFIEYRQEKFAN